jgi:chromosome segregation ATPase
MAQKQTEETDSRQKSALAAVRTESTDAQKSLSSTISNLQRQLDEVEMKWSKSLTDNQKAAATQVEALSKILNDSQKALNDSQKATENKLDSLGTEIRSAVRSHEEELHRNKEEELHRNNMALKSLSESLSGLRRDMDSSLKEMGSSLKELNSELRAAMQDECQQRSEEVIALRHMAEELSRELNTKLQQCDTKLQQCDAQCIQLAEECVQLGECDEKLQKQLTEVESRIRQVTESLQRFEGTFAVQRQSEAQHHQQLERKQQEQDRVL